MPTTSKPCSCLGPSGDFMVVMNAVEACWVLSDVGVALNLCTCSFLMTSAIVRGCALNLERIS